MVNRSSDQMEAKPTSIFQNNLKQFDAPSKNKIFGKMTISDDKDGDVPVIKFSDGDKYFDENVDSDSDVISQYIGHYGWWQFFWTVLLGLCQCPSTFQIYAFVFQGYKHEHHCARPEGMENITILLWRNLTNPCEPIDLKSILLATQQTFDTTEDFHPFDCDAYEFDGHENVVSEWNLVCDREYLVSVVEMCFLAGAAIGSICSGWVSDRYGRRHTLMVLILMQAIFVKCSIGATNALIPIFTAIQYPTAMRTLSVGIGNFAAGLALITVPYLWLLEHVQKDLPMTLMGCFGLIGAGALILMKDKALNLASDEKNVKGTSNNNNNNVKGTNGVQTISSGCIDA